jgi:cytidyltransferase-like protein
LKQPKTRVIRVIRAKKLCALRGKSRLNRETMPKRKILPFDTLSRTVREIQKEGKKAVLCYGLFNVLHIGHIRYLRKAKSYGDFLFVVIMPDPREGPKSKERFEDMRAEALAHLDWIDAVSIDIHDSFREMIKVLTPDVYVKGFESGGSGDQTSGDDYEDQLCRGLGIELVVAKEDNSVSTDQINRYLSNFSDDNYSYLELFKQRYSSADFERLFEQIEKLKVLVIGDTIIDEYQFCSAIGKSSKDPTLALKYQSSDTFAGGVLAVANHVAGFVQQVDVVTVLGEKESYEEFILSSLKSNVSPHYIFRPNAPTLLKRRFVEGHSMNKLLEIYVMDDSFLDEKQDMELCALFREKLHSYDLVVVSDFGHGAISRYMIDILARNAPFLAVNTQSNAGNRGFNTITKYPRADYVSLAEHEIRLEMRDLGGRLFPMIRKLAQDMSSRHFVVTRGKKGCMLTDRHGALFQVPSFPQNVVDRIGAGDAFFVTTSLFSALDAPGELLGFIGNVVGSLAVSIMGNKKSIDKDSVMKYIHQLLL